LFIKKFEGCELKHTNAQQVFGQLDMDILKMFKKVISGLKKKLSLCLWDELEEEYEKYINDLVDVPLSQFQFDALVSWVYNLGPANLKSSTMLKKLNAGEYEEVPSQMKRWNKATVDGERKVLAGLTRRREAEALMFEGKKWEHI
jgi:GH24 family phage-related lysozyme (muramidase)